MPSSRLRVLALAALSVVGVLACSQDEPLAPLPPGVIDGALLPGWNSSIGGAFGCSVPDVGGRVCPSRPNMPTVSFATGRLYFDSLFYPFQGLWYTTQPVRRGSYYVADSAPVPMVPALDATFSSGTMVVRLDIKGFNFGGTAGAHHFITEDVPNAVRVVVTEIDGRDTSFLIGLTAQSCSSFGNTCQNATTVTSTIGIRRLRAYQESEYHIGYQMTIAREPVAVVPTPSFTCTPDPVTRGAMVACQLDVIPHRSFRVKWLAATASGYEQVDSVDADWETDGPYVWNGPAVTTTVVRAQVALLDNGAEKLLPIVSDTFRVVARTGAAWDDRESLKLPASPPQPSVTEGAPLLANPLPFLAEARNDSPDGALGQTVFGFSLTHAVVGGGPNKGLAFTASIPENILVDLPVKIWIHAWLMPNGRLARAQPFDDHTVMGRSNCTRASIPRLRQEVIEHENRHYAVLQRFLDTASVRRSLEPVYTRVRSMEALYSEDSTARNSARAEIVRDLQQQAFLAGLTQLQDVVDKEHPVAIPGCRFELPRN